MIRSARTLVVLAGLAALAVPSQAVITFSNYASDAQFAFSPMAPNQLSTTPKNLSGIVTTAYTTTGWFDVQATNGLSALDVNEVLGTAKNGSLALTVTLYTGALNTSPVLQTIYVSSATGGATNAFLASSQDNALADLTGIHAVSFVATFTPMAGGAKGHLGAFAIDAYEQAVPEPAAFATLGVGLIGLLASKRRSRK